MALGGALERLGGRRGMQPHCNACQQNSRGPPPPQQHNVQSTPAPPHYRPFNLFCFIHVVCLFAPSLKPKITAHLQSRKKENTIPPSRHGPTLYSTHHHCRAGGRGQIAEEAPQCAAHHCAVSNGLDAAMHRPAPFSHPSSLACSAQSSKQKQSARKRNHPPHSLKHIISHGMTFKDTPALAGCVEFPCQPCEDTITLRGKSDSPSVLSVVHMAGQIPRTHSSGFLAT
ncbi:hypothetical protein TcCL_ESM08816 [Trypanosoma cruzi]|nr:hypothetical protein TcCL_ESM08816 [Trypanosoma cruzi]